ncbi:hypothetical protein ABE67_23105 [Cytobacillus firmus]|uniref:alginate lyase family protein n=1 Tax=Cytobacillus firmus TaxID=1399 RepID=UPI0018CD16DD|nr:alginate lyase family protein [Cytobacillus firmus]MBG9452163.1 hypothetical protein [Cytobacillus firmus]
MNTFIPPNLNFERLNAILSALPKSRNKNHLIAANNILLKNMYTLPPFGVVKFSKLIDWNDNRSRSFERLLHGFTFLGCLTDAYLESGDKKYLLKGLELIFDWLGKHSYETHKGHMAFHDETTAVRLQYFLRFYIVARECLSEHDNRTIEKNMWKTAELLANDEFHATNTNHGMFQDIALLLFSLYFDGEKCIQYKNLAVNRLKNYFTNVFTSDGVHKEHSPSYHMLVASNIKKLTSWMEEIDPSISREFTTLFNNSEDYSVHIIRPDGYFPALCDTESKPVIESSYAKLYDSDQYKYAVTSGKSGRAPVESDRVFPFGGYAIFRDDWLKKEKGTYVLFSAAYHGTYHKHSDDLNLTIYSDGEIISEAGPHGYNYQDPYTKFAYSSFAHNTLIVDGKGLPRTDSKYDKVFIADYIISAEESHATGVNMRYDGVTHKRKIQYNKPKKEIVAYDTINSEQNHKYTLLWHVAPDIEVRSKGKFIELYRKKIKVMEIEISTNAKFNINQVSGQKDPRIQGWYFPKMEDQKSLTTLEVHFSENSNIECLTYFRLGSFKLKSSYLFGDEHIFYSDRDIKYYYMNAKDEADKGKLYICFTDAFQNQGTINSLEGIKGNCLMILDDEKGSYLKGYKKDNLIETSVVSLIQSIIAENNISLTNVTAIGSSNNGFVALYYGLKYFFGNIIVGAPPFYLGNYLIDQTNSTEFAPFPTGVASEENKKFLNQMLGKVIGVNAKKTTKISILVGKQDQMYEGHVLPLYEQLCQKGYKAKLDVKTDLTHEDTINKFPQYIKALSSSGTNSLPAVRINSLDFKKTDKNILKITCNAIGTKLEYAYYIYLNGAIIKKIPYQISNTMEYSPEKTGEYLIRVYVRDQFKDKKTLNSKVIEI